MALSRLTLTQAEAAALGAAFQALQRGDTQSALTCARQVLKDAPDAPDALHLLALALRNAGDARGAEDAFERALKGAPRHVDVLNNYAGFLQRAGRIEEAIARFQQALAANAARSDIWINLALAQTAGGEAEAAVTSANRALALAPNSVRALRTLAGALRDSADLDGAERTLRKASGLEPQNGEVWTALGVIRRMIGDPKDALACYAKARACGYAALELDEAEASAHLDAGDVAEALKRTRALTAKAPDYVAGQLLLAHMLWENRSDDGDDPLASLAQAVAQQPEHDALRNALVGGLLDAQRGQEALPHVRILRGRKDTGQLVMAHALALEQMGELASAVAVVDAALPTVGAPRGLGGAFARLLLRVRQPDRAAKFALMEVERSPEDQGAWAMLSTAWRMLDDPREFWLCDYERLIIPVDVEPPAGHADASSFTNALAQTLEALHVAVHEPINQSLRGGTQTPGNLFGRPDPAIIAARDALHASVRKAIAALPRDEKHPFLSKNTGDIRFNGAWSVRLRQSGSHVNHFHNRGWMSSAFYVQLPPSVASGDARHPGWIQFGEPPAHLDTGLGPRRVVQPKVGRLVVFPSYMWHGTVPFADETPRITIAFDALPA